MRLRRFSWHNGWAAIDFCDYRYDNHWFSETAHQLETLLSFTTVSAPVNGLDSTIIAFQCDSGDVLFHMDNYTCSLAFASKEACDDAILRMVTTLGWQHSS